MPYAYEGPATVTVMALHVGQAPNELTTLELPIVLSNAGRGYARIEYGHYLQGPRQSRDLLINLRDRSHEGRSID